MVCEPTSESAKLAGRRYRRDMAIAALIYVTVVFGAVFAIRNLELPHWLVVLLALASFAPALLMLRAYLVYWRSLDEFQRRVQSEALIVAAALVVFGSFAYGFLEEWADFPHVPMIWIFPVYSFVFGIAHRIIGRRYK